MLKYKDLNHSAVLVFHSVAGKWSLNLGKQKQIKPVSDAANLRDIHQQIWGFLDGVSGKELACQCR